MVKEEKELEENKKSINGKHSRKVGPLGGFLVGNSETNRLNLHMRVQLSTLDFNKDKELTYT